MKQQDITYRKRVALILVLVRAVNIPVIVGLAYLATVCADYGTMSAELTAAHVRLFRWSAEFIGGAIWIYLVTMILDIFSYRLAFYPRSQLSPANDSSIE
jgi:hypothetical protein